jgi:hypothetical protein
MAEYTITVKTGNGAAPQTTGRVVAARRLGVSYPATQLAPRGGGDGQIGSGDGQIGSGDGQIGSGDGQIGSGDGQIGSGGTGSCPTVVIGPIVIAR